MDKQKHPDIQSNELTEKQQNNQENQNFQFNKSQTLEYFRLKLQNFADDRDWNQYHKPRNLLLALTGEIGELAELFQWKGEVEEGLPDYTEQEKIRVGEELSDCMFYLIRLADKCKIDLPQAMERKYEMNGQKYPVELCKGSSKKYDEIRKQYKEHKKEQNSQDQNQNQ